MNTADWYEINAAIELLERTDKDQHLAGEQLLEFNIAALLVTRVGLGYFFETDSKIAGWKKEISRVTLSSLSEGQQIRRTQAHETLNIMRMRAAKLCTNDVDFVDWLQGVTNHDAWWKGLIARVKFYERRDKYSENC